MSHDSSLRFPKAEIRAVEKVSLDNDQEQWKVLIDFIGLTGAMGVMPFHYSEMILKRLKQKDPSMLNFLNLFNHRTASLFFQASSKYHLALEYERSKLLSSSRTKPCWHTQSLLSLIGMGTEKLINRQHIKDESLIFYSGLLSQQVRSPEGLRQIIQHYFDVPAQIESFIGQWQGLIDDVRTRLPWKTQPKGQNARLGRSAMLGSKGWFAQGKARVKIGPLNKEQFYRFAPGTGALRSLNEIVRTYLGMDNDYDFVLEVNRRDVPNKVALDSSAPPTLSWNAWLSGRPKTRTQKDEILEILVSSKRLN